MAGRPNVIPILEVSEAKEEDRNVRCNSCFENKTEYMLRIGYNNQSVSLRLCRNCLDILSQKMWDIDLPPTQKCTKIVLPSGMEKMPNNCFECTMSMCELPLNEEESFSNTYKRIRHPHCPLIEVVTNGS